MTVTFSKYQGTGNDFVIIDQMKKSIDFSKDQLAHLCDRRFGIGADGVMLLRASASADFQMVYFNADGNESSMCGNGGRCLVHFANAEGYIGLKTSFDAIDGRHDAEIISKQDAIVALHMNDVQRLDSHGSAILIDTGSPHYVRFEKDIENIDLIKEGRAIRYSDDFKLKGINVNLVELMENGIYVRTYERGVEDETLSCGTGVTASVIAAAAKNYIEGGTCHVKTKGGYLTVNYKKSNNIYTDNWLIGPGVCVFKGEINI
jgi:diaminopimelate epimerase